ncbi:roadblock/LC7 domain-containing protein [Promethearchaeum syntrophicum]|uniref:Roadblock/LC7 domain-containing protein n=1 Tax=Promethearchaeum syntrophicum TaxID=2594042 RepID=A0A5B9DAR5_9ARCH|nr:roadblock/LC7 domain-containing protein [Candidatus Prometheoarchaeum syntrophicum]QEE16233.1 Roadblock/LC7 domain protein [Candidatus Prometheoarchaeum syntrophicum]
MIAEETAHALMVEIQRVERGTDLKRVAIISRIGMAIATSTSDSMNADAETASSSALIDLAERLSTSVDHGDLREILVKADSGFVILQFINEEYMIFGGISNPLRIGYYMEYLRNEAHKFAYILAGNKVTAALQKEIEAEKGREERKMIEAKAPMAKDFKMDKDKTDDIQAMEGVLSFLKDWGGEEEENKPDNQNIVSIDRDLMFGIDDLAPQPISQDQISSAQQTSTGLEPITEAEDLVALVDNQHQQSEEGLPDDILSALDEISETTRTTVVSSKAEQAQAKDPNLPYGIPIFENEVPPVPLEDYVNFEIGTLTGSSPSTPAQTPSSTPITSTAPLTAATDYDPFTTNIKLNSDGTPNFDAMSSEYDDVDLNIEEDAMLDALEDLEFDMEEKKKKSK